MLSSVIAILILILINGFFSCSEIALISVRPAALKEKAEGGSKKAEKALELSEEPTRLLATIQIAITLVGFGASAVATATLADPLARAFNSLGISWLTPVSVGIAVALVTLLISYVTLVIGELVPKRLGMAKSESIAMFVAGPIGVLETVLRPVVWLLSKSTNAVFSLTGIKDEDIQSSVTEEEIKLLVTEQETLQDEEKRLINEIFEVGDTVVREIMVPRVDMMLIEDTETIARAIDIMRGTGFSRVPVFHEDHDKVVGILLIKDLFTPLLEGETEALVTEFMRTPVFVPESKEILPLLSDMQENRQQMAIVVDEYGGTAGLVTTEDIVEEIVGEIEDEFDPDRKYITQVTEEEYLLDGRLPIDDAQELGLPLEEDEDYDTVAGWMLDALGRVPSVGDVLEYEGCTFTVASMRRRRISKMRVIMPAGHDNDQPPKSNEGDGDGQSDTASNSEGTEEAL